MNQKQGTEPFGVKKYKKGGEGSGNQGGAEKAVKNDVRETSSIPTVNEKRNKVLYYGSKTNY